MGENSLSSLVLQQACFGASPVCKRNQCQSFSRQTGELLFLGNVYITLFLCNVTTGEKKLIDSILLAVQSTVPDTSTWSWSGSLVMNISIILGIIIAKVGIQNKGKGPKLPLLEPFLGKNFGLPELLAGISFGHLIGVGATLSLTITGLLT